MTTTRSASSSTTTAAGPTGSNGTSGPVGSERSVAAAAVDDDSVLVSDEVAVAATTATSVPGAASPFASVDSAPAAGTTTGVSVEAKGLGRSFGARRVLGGIDLQLAPGEFVALLGRSGTGKSTLLRALAGLDPDYEGELRVPRARAVVFQEPRLLPWARVLRNVTLGLPGGRAAANARGRAALAEVGLSSHERAWPVTLSGGEAQRVALARALVREPDLLLLDEPFGALDALTRIRMHALLADLCRRHRPAVLLVTHDVDEAIVLADRVLVLAEGDITVDEEIELPSPRQRSDRGFVDLRTRLLEALGVEDDA